MLSIVLAAISLYSAGVADDDDGDDDLERDVSDRVHSPINAETSPIGSEPLSRPLNPDATEFIPGGTEWHEAEFSKHAHLTVGTSMHKAYSCDGCNDGNPTIGSFLRNRKRSISLHDLIWTGDAEHGDDLHSANNKNAAACREAPISAEATSVCVSGQDLTSISSYDVNTLASADPWSNASAMRSFWLPSHGVTAWLPYKARGAMRVIQANVCTLHPEEYRGTLASCQATYSTRITSLEVQFAANDVDAIGVQEARLQVEGSIKGTNYAIHSSACTATGEFGVQVWLTYKLNKDVIQTLSVSERLLFVVVQTGTADTLQCTIFASAHAPTSARPPDERASFWQCLSCNCTKLLAKYPNACMCLLIDGNANLGSVCDSVVGNSMPCIENDNGTSLRLFANEFGTSLVNTFRDSAFTYAGGNDFDRRIDYIGLSKPTFDGGYVGGGPVECIDLAVSMRLDHRAIYCDFLCGAVGPSLHNKNKNKSFDNKTDRNEFYRTQQHHDKILKCTADLGGLSDPLKAESLNEAM